MKVILSLGNSTTVRKIRGPDGKLCLAVRGERKNKLSKHNSRLRVDAEEVKKNFENEERNNSEILIDKHPFVSEVIWYKLVFKTIKMSLFFC